MPYEFTSDLVTGNPAIDTQHRQLIQAINALLEACSTGQGRAALAKTTTFLYEYTARHFADEERLQVQARYPGYSEHHRYHETFKRTVKDLNARLEVQGPNVALVAEVNSAVAGWLLNHIRREDVKVAAHLRKTGG